MTNYIIIGVLALIMLIIGIVIGREWASLKGKNQTKDLEKALSNANLRLQNAENRAREIQDRHQREIEKLDSLYQQQVEVFTDDLKEMRTQKEQITNDLTRRNTEFKNLQQKNEEQQKEVVKLQEKFEKEFENLANKILEQKSEKFTRQNEKNIKDILTPLKEKIKGFEEEIRKNRDSSVKRHAALDKHLKTLNEQNLKISQEAINLTNALKGESKTQGNWGEKILQRVLEKSGLQEGREYVLQQSYKNEEGKTVYPDVVIKLPREKEMIIDAKVSLTAYEKYVNSTDKKQRQRYLKEHIASLKSHIKELHKKKYEDLIEGKSPDFVLLFVPIEPALYKAQEENSSFFYTAFEKNILLVSPTTLLATLRTVDALWSNEKQQENAREIAHHAASLYHKFQGLLTHFDTVGKRITSTHKAYEEAMKKLTGQQNLIKDIEKLEQLGISPKKKMDQKWLDKADN